MKSAFQLHIDDQNIARLYFDLPNEKVNLFNERVLDELEEILDRLEKAQPAALLILSKKEGIYIAGADVNAFQKIDTLEMGWQAARRGQLVFHRLSKLPFVTIAVIHGACMGGGTEMSLACDYRLATDHPKTRIGLPEVRLGILPGWGGTQRLPAVTGLSAALSLILTGKAVSAKKARAIGLVERILDPQNVEEQALRFAREAIQKSSKIKKRKIFRMERIGFIRRLIFSQARKSVLKQTRGFYPAPLKAIEVIKKTWNMPIEQGLEVEARALAELIITPQSKNLVRLFIWSEELKKEARNMLSAYPSGQTQRVLFFNVDSTFSALFPVLLRKGMKVTVIDFDRERLSAVRQSFLRQLKRQRQKKKITAVKFHRLLQDISFLDTLPAIEESDLLFTGSCNESLWRQIQQKAPETVRPIPVIPPFISKTSNGAAAVNFCTWQKNPFAAEVILSDNKAQESLRPVLDLLLRINRLPVMARGYSIGLATRLFLTLVGEAARMFNEGYAEKQIDEALTRFGWTQGPFEMARKMGLKNLRLWLQQVDPQKDDTLRLDVKAVLEWSGKARSKRGAAKITEADAQNIQDRLHLLLINRAAFLLEKGLTQEARDLDFLMVGALGFPPFAGGILKYGDHIGINAVINQLKQLSQRLGKRFEASTLLKQMSRERQLFYP
ncbi:enoyl-CoA hydratase-related protein [Calditrichota bacterium LG25]